MGCALALVAALVVEIEPCAAHPVSAYRFYVYPHPVGHADQSTHNITSATRLASRGLEELAIHTWEPAAEAAGVSVVSRALEMVLLQTPIAFYGSLVPHEVSGHGARALELGFEPSYGFKPPLPYYVPVRGSWGFTDVGPRDLPPTLDEELLIILGGLEAGELQVRQVEIDGFRSDALRQGDLLLYLGNRLHLPSMLPRPQSDASRYAELVAARSDADRDAAKEELGTAALVSLLDPMFLYGGYALLVPMVVEGDRVVGYPALEPGGLVRLSGSYRPRPVPWGLEHQLTMLVGGELGSAAIRARIGKGLEEGSLATSVDLYDVPVSDQVSLGAAVEIWSQPRLELARDVPGAIAGMTGVGMLGPMSVAASRRVVGGAARVLGEFHRGPWLWGLTLGGKTEGLRAGQPLAAEARAAAFAGVRL